MFYLNPKPAKKKFDIDKLQTKQQKKKKEEEEIPKYETAYSSLWNKERRTLKAYLRLMWSSGPTGEMT